MKKKKSQTSVEQSGNHPIIAAEENKHPTSRIAKLTPDVPEPSQVPRRNPARERRPPSRYGFDLNK